MPVPSRLLQLLDLRVIFSPHGESSGQPKDLLTEEEE